MQARTPLARLTVHAVLLIGGFLFVFPLLWMIATSVKPLSQTKDQGLRILPRAERIVGSDGREYPAAFWQEPLAPGERRLKEEKLVALVAREGGQAVIELDVAGGRKERKTVPDDQVRVPGTWRWENYWKAITYKQPLLGYAPFPRYARNTLYIALLAVVGTVLSSSLVAYGFARLQWPGRDVAFAVTIATMMVPFPVLMVPIYVLFKEFGWVGSPKPLWVPSFFGSAFNIFLLRQFFMSLPFELSQAARIDGCSEFGIYRDVILPLSKPALAVVALFTFMYHWNDFLGPLIYLTDQRSYTLAYGLQAFQSQHGGTQWPMLMAAAAIVIAPVVALYFLAQKTFIQGITVTGMKN